MINKGAMLDQAIAARPTAGYDTRLGATSALDYQYVRRSRIYQHEAKPRAPPFENKPGQPTIHYRVLGLPPAGFLTLSLNLYSSDGAQ